MRLVGAKTLVFKKLSYFLLTFIASFRSLAANSSLKAQDDQYQIQFDQVLTLPREQQNQHLVHLAQELSDLQHYDKAIHIYRQMLKESSCLEEATKVWLAIADTYLKANQLEKSLNELEAIHLLLPDSPTVKEREFSVLVMLARNAAALEQTQKSVEYYQKALQIDPDKRLQILREYAELLTYDSKAHLAIPLYQEVLASRLSVEEEKAALIGLARAYTWRQNYQEAIETNRRVLQIDPDYNSYEFFTTLAKDAADHNKPQLSVEYYHKAIETDPSQKHAIIRDYAKQLSYAGKAQEATDIYLELLTTNLVQEERRLLELDLAQAFIWTKQYALATEHYDALLASNPSDVEAKKGKAQIYLDYGNFNAGKNLHKEALEWYFKALEADPNRRLEILKLIADQLTLNSQAALAIPKYLEIIYCYPTPEMHYQAKIGLARAYIANRQFQEGITLLNEILKTSPEDKNVENILLTTYLDLARDAAKRDQASSALNWYLNAMSLDPKQRSALLREYALELTKNGEAIKAIPLFNEILDAHPEPGNVRLLKLDLAHAYASIYQYKEALAIYDELLKANPADALARRGKALIYIDYARYDARRADHPSAISSYNEAITIDPSLKNEIFGELAAELEKNFEETQAISIYREMLETKPKKDEERILRLNLARLYKKKYQYEEALKQYDVLLTQDRYDQFARQGKAQVYIDYAEYNSKQNRPIEAIDWYQEAIENDPIIVPDLLKRIEEEKAKIEESKKTIPLSIDIPKQGEQAQDLLDKRAKDDSQFTKQNGQETIEVNTETDPLPQEEKQILPSETQEDPYEKQKACAKVEYENGLELAKRLEVFQANRAFKRSIEADPDNRGYREQYAWHLQAFSFIEDAVPQFYLLLAEAQEKAPFYRVLGWDLRSLGQLDQSLWAFSHLYPIPHCFTLSNKFVLIGNLYRREEYRKINELYRLLECQEENEWEVRKKLFDAYAYLGHVREAGFFADQILSVYPDEYGLHYRYAYTLYQKRMYSESAFQYQLLLQKLPGNAFLYLALGKVYEEMGCLANAREAYRTALHLDQNSRTERAYARILAKLGYCCEAKVLANEIVPEGGETLIKSLSLAETNLNCGKVETASTIYRDILDEYPYNQEALWGILKASTITDNFEDNRLSYRRWPTIWFNYPFQNYLADYYRSPDVTLSGEFFNNSSKFRRFAAGSALSQYVGCNTRIAEGYYFTQFSQKNFDTIDRNTAFLNVQKFFDKGWEGHVRLIGNHYHKLQHKYSNTSQVDAKRYSKWIYNCHFHLLNHVTDQLMIDIGYDYYDVIDTIPPFDNPIYNYSNQIGATALNIRTSDLNVFFNYRKERFYMMGNWITGRYSDGNTKQTRFMRTGYRICEIPILSLFYSYFFLNFKKAAPLFTQNGFSEGAYYDPKNFENHIVGLDSRYDITENLQIGGELAALYIPKCKNFAYSASTFLNYLLDDQWSLRLDMRYYYQNRSLNRSGITGYYYADSANLQIRYQF